MIVLSGRVGASALVLDGGLLYTGLEHDPHLGTEVYRRISDLECSAKANAERRAIDRRDMATYCRERSFDKAWRSGANAGMTPTGMN